MNIKQLDPTLDPFRFDIFQSVEAYEDIIGSLTALYTHLYYREIEKENSDVKLAQSYMNRLHDIRQTKNKFPNEDIIDRDKQFVIYLREYKEMSKITSVSL